MTGSGSGPLGLLLMIAPLAAIPFFAIVGVPQFAPLSASQAEEEDSIEWNEPAARSTSTAPVESAPKSRNADDLFAPVAAPSAGSATSETTSPGSRPGSGAPSGAGQSNNSGRWLPPPEALDEWEIRADSSEAGRKQRLPQKSGSSDSTRRDNSRELETPVEDDDDDEFVSAEGFDPGLLKIGRSARPGSMTRPAEEALRGAGTAKRTKPELKQVSEPLTELESESDADSLALSVAEQEGWQTAARRLKELGISKYRLESQIEEQTFVFTCDFASPDNPRVVRRFEADAETPLEAVQKVLKQIDEWRGRDK